jgi:hypothetical protein
MERVERNEHGYTSLAWKVFLRDRARCQYCGLSGEGDFLRWRELTLDRLSPRPPEGGEDRPEDVVLACRRCAQQLRDWEEREPVREEDEPRPLLEEHEAYRALMRALRADAA